MPVVVWSVLFSLLNHQILKKLKNNASYNGKLVCLLVSVSTLKSSILWWVANSVHFLKITLFQYYASGNLSSKILQNIRIYSLLRNRFTD